jgi:hypothetical protein
MSDAGERLVRSRMAIVDHIERKDRRKALSKLDDGVSGGHGRFGHVVDTLRSWWRRHPVSMAVDFATPSLSAYAGRHPVKFLGTALVVGAVAFYARPWKVISLTGLVVALMKSSQLSGLVMSAMSAADDRTDVPARR